MFIKNFFDLLGNPNDFNDFLCVNGNNFVDLNNTTFFGYGLSDIFIEYNASNFLLPKGSFFSIPNQFNINGTAFLIKKENYQGMLLMGLLENYGRLKYIDGCTDSILIHPIKKGDACLNALYFPKNINQSPHTHPSIRIGIVSDGQGFAVTKDYVSPLKKGDVFVIQDNEIHNFETKDSGMVVIAYHPDSDFGALDHDHPMINKTFLT